MRQGGKGWDSVGWDGTGWDGMGPGGMGWDMIAGPFQEPGLGSWRVHSSRPLQAAEGEALPSKRPTRNATHRARSHPKAGLSGRHVQRKARYLWLGSNFSPVNGAMALLYSSRRNTIGATPTWQIRFKGDCSGKTGTRMERTGGGPGGPAGWAWDVVRARGACPASCRYRAPRARQPLSSRRPRPHLGSSPPQPHLVQQAFIEHCGAVKAQQ
jgi:hypothetical protein